MFYCIYVLLWLCSNKMMLKIHLFHKALSSILGTWSTPMNDIKSSVKWALVRSQSARCHRHHPHCMAWPGFMIAVPMSRLSMQLKSVQSAICLNIFFVLAKSICHTHIFLSQSCLKFSIFRLGGGHDPHWLCPCPPFGLHSETRDCSTIFCFKPRLHQIHVARIQVVSTCIVIQVPSSGYLYPTTCIWLHFLCSSIRESKLQYNVWRDRRFIHRRHWCCSCFGVVRRLVMTDVVDRGEMQAKRPGLTRVLIGSVVAVLGALLMCNLS